MGLFYSMIQLSIFCSFIVSCVFSWNSVFTLLELVSPLDLRLGTWFQIPALLLVTSMTLDKPFRFFYYNFLLDKIVIIAPIFEDPSKDSLA